MQVELNDDERQAIRRALEVYLSDLREEIAKTEKQDRRTELHAEKEALERAVSKLD